MKKDFEEYRERTEKVLSVLGRCFERPNCIIHEGDLELMYRAEEGENEKFFLTERGLDLEFSRLEYVVDFLKGVLN